jgi:CheY-like chemotaxis protein
LIVDDEDDIREVAGASLELTYGWSILSARNGKEGLEVAFANAPDAILLDVMMPDMDGPTAFGFLRADERTVNTPVILLTAKVQAADRQRYLQIGVQGVIAKPFDPLRLADEVAEILHWR